MQSERERIYKYINENVQEITAIELEVIADYILQEKQKSYNQGVIDTYRKILRNYHTNKIDGKGFDFYFYINIELENELNKQSAESLGEK